MLLDDLKQMLRERPEHRDLLDELNEAITIDLQNVADYQNASKSDLDLKTLDLAPPFQSMWLEWKDPCACCKGTAHPATRIGINAWSVTKDEAAAEYRSEDG